MPAFFAWVRETRHDPDAWPVLQRLLDEGLDPCEIEPVEGLSLLHQAVDGDDEAQVHALLMAMVTDPAGRRKRVNVRTRGRREGATPLHLASLQGSTSIAQALMMVGADPNMALPFSGRTALHLAAQSNAEASTLILSLLLAGASIDLPDGQGMTALHWAADHAHGAVVRTLLEAGADPTVRNHAQCTVEDIVQRASYDLGDATAIVTLMAAYRGRHEARQLRTALPDQDGAPEGTPRPGPRPRL